MTAASRTPSRRRARRVRTIAIAAAGLALFVTAVRVSLAGILHDGRPVEALRWAPFDAIASAQAASNVAGLGLEPETAKQVERLARDALARDATQVEALFALGASAEAGGDTSRAYRLLSQADRQSRREREVQMWFLRYHADRADVPAIMRAFDVALRTSNRNWNQIFGLMASVSADPQVARGLSARLRGEPDWGPEFLAQLAESSADLPSAVAIARPYLDPKDPFHQGVIASLVRRLAAEGYPQLAWQVHGDATGPRRAAVRGGNFAQAGMYPPLDWQLADQSDLSAYVEGLPDGGNALFMIASNGRSGEVARQLLHLAPGRYAFSARVGNLPPDPLDRPNVRIFCFEAAAPQNLLELRPTGARLNQAFSIPGSCQWQWLTISLSGDGPPSDSIIWMDDVAIRALR